MNVKELIEELEKIRKDYGGQLEVIVAVNAVAKADSVEVLGDKSAVLIFGWGSP